VKAIRTLAVVLATWIFWAVLFFAPIPFLPRTNFLGLITAAVCFFVMPSGALKATREWRDHGRVKAPQSKIPAALLGFQRHVALGDDGMGLTFRIVKGPGGPRFMWFFDPGIDSDTLMTTIRVKEELAKIETELGLPVTFRHVTAEGREERRQRDRERQAETAARAAAERPTLSQLQTAAEAGEDLAALRAWGHAGSPVTDPEELVVGRYYYLGGDVAKYTGSNEEGTWFTFSPAQGAGGGTARYRADELKEVCDDGTATIYAPAVPKKEAARVFQAFRAAHVEREARQRTR
jgi:hypothetical protein